MKTAKRKFLQTLVTLLLIVLQCTMSVHAGGLTQSGESVSVTLSHEHTQADCFSRIWVPCGGWWSSYFEEYVGATVYVCTNGSSSEIRNGVALSSIHPGWEYKSHSGLHDGEYVNRRTCDQDVAGEFTVTKIVTGTEGAAGSSAELAASVTDQGTGISGVSFCWQCPDGSMAGGERITISQNGIYRAMLEWSDAKTGILHTAALDYVELSNPILLVFRSGEGTVEEIEVSYGDPLPDIEIPVKEGYDFKGYYAGLAEEGENTGEPGGESVRWYDEQARPDSSITLTGSALREILTAKWEARSYHVYYGKDNNEDGIGDHDFYATYGAEYGPVEVDGEERAGYVFDGYYLGRERVFDAEGCPTGVWRWDADGDIILTALYHKRSGPSSGSGHSGNREEGERNEGAAPSGRVSGNTLPDRSVSGNRVSDNGISENAVSFNQISENGVSGDGAPGGGSAGGRQEAGREHGGRPDGGNYGGNRESRETGTFHGRISQEGGEDASGTALPGGGVTQEEALLRISENMAPGRSAETGLLYNSSVAARTLETAGVAAGVLGLAYLAVWMMITKASFAELFSVRADEARRRLGAVLILHGENAFHIRIKDRMLEKGETGRYQIVFRKRFASRHANQDIILHCGEREIAEMVRPDIIFFLK